MLKCTILMLRSQEEMKIQCGILPVFEKESEKKEERAISVSVYKAEVHSLALISSIWM